MTFFFMVLTEKITGADFFRAESENVEYILKANCSMVVRPRETEREKLNKQIAGDDDKSHTKNDGYTFGRCARSRFSANLSAFAMCYNGNFGFLTLTFPPCQYDGAYNPKLFDSVLTDCCQRYFKRLTRENRIAAFAWVAERHESDDKRHKKTQGLHKDFLHYHCFVFFNGFQPIKKLNSIWLEILQNCKIIQFKTVNEKNNPFAAVDCEFISIQKTLFNDCAISKMLVYVKKYATKNAENGVIYSRRWGWSRNISKIKSSVVINAADLYELIDAAINPNDFQQYTDFYKVSIFTDEKTDEAGAVVRAGGVVQFELLTARLPYQLANSAVFHKLFINLNKQNYE